MEISGLDTTLVIIAAVVVALNQALKDASKMRAALPGWVKSPRWNYVPAALIGIAAVVFIYGKVSPPPPKEEMPTIRTVTKTVYINVPTADPKQAAEILDLQRKLGDATSRLAKLGPHKSISVPPSAPQSTQPPISNSGSGNAFSFGQHGGITAGTLNVGKPDRLLDEMGKQKLLSLLPKGTKTISVSSTIGDLEAARLAQQIVSFFNQSTKFKASYAGPNLTVVPGVYLFPKPDDAGDETIIVGANAQ